MFLRYPSSWYCVTVWYHNKEQFKNNAGSLPKCSTHFLRLGKPCTQYVEPYELKKNLQSLKPTVIVQATKGYCMDTLCTETGLAKNLQVCRLQALHVNLCRLRQFFWNKYIRMYIVRTNLNTNTSFYWDDDKDSHLDVKCSVHLYRIRSTLYRVIQIPQGYV